MAVSWATKGMHRSDHSVRCNSNGACYHLSHWGGEGWGVGGSLSLALGLVLSVYFVCWSCVHCVVEPLVKDIPQNDTGLEMKRGGMGVSTHTLHPTPIIKSLWGEAYWGIENFLSPKPSWSGRMRGRGGRTLQNYSSLKKVGGGGGGGGG